MASPVCGLILLGNSGAGKSFLANCLLNDDRAFESRYSVKSVTRHTEWRDMPSAHDPFYAVANIPGLIEADQRLIDENRAEIMKAFERYSTSIVLFVFGHRNGRIPDEDLIAFERIDAAYELARPSLMLIVNGIPPDRPEYYEEHTAQLLSELTTVPEDQIYFIEQNDSDEGRQAIRDFLHEIVRRCEPAQHHKRHDIQLLTDEIAELKAQSKQRQAQLIARQEAARKNRQQPSPPARQIAQTASPDQQLTEWLHAQRAEFDQHTSKIVTALQRPNQSLTLQLANQIKADSERNMADIAQLASPSRTVVIVSNRRHGRKRDKLQQGCDFIEDTVEDIVDEHPPLPPHPFDARSCK